MTQSLGSLCPLISAASHQCASGTRWLCSQAGMLWPEIISLSRMQHSWAATIAAGLHMATEARQWLHAAQLVGNCPD